MRSSLLRTFLLALFVLGSTVLTGCPDPDEDGDGHTVGNGDCNDTDDTIFPGAIEIVCDEIDQNCDGVDRQDLDDDGVTSCPGADPFDCDDEDPDRYPGNPEVCNGADEDCDGVADNGLPVFQWWVDGDADTFGAGAITSTCEVEAPTDEHVSADAPAEEDCDDGDAAINPGATEICNQVDDDCDGVADDGLGDNVYWADVDGDLVGDSTSDVTTCNDTPPTGYVVPGADTDCDDTDAAIYPGATEICDGVDQDCDSVADNGLAVSDYWADVDGDGVGDSTNTVSTCEALPPTGYLVPGAETDCDDTDGTRYPGNTEICDAVDNDCDTDVDEDFNTDSDPVSQCGPDGDIATPADNDCDDTDPLNFPGNTEVCDDQNNDCDADVDEGFDTDNDTYTPCGASVDCDDTNPSTYPTASEICDGLDNDCDTSLPANEVDGDSDLYIDCTVPGGIVLPGALLGGDDCDDGQVTVNPGAAVDTCDGVDTDCDTVLAPTEVDDDGDLYLDCSGFVDLGLGFLGGEDCDDTVGTGAAVFPGATEVCDGDLEDCGGTIDQGFDVDGDLYFDGADAGCVAFYTLVDCLDSDAFVYPTAPEVCDLVDNDCDTLVDAADPGFTGSDNDGDGDAAIACGGGDCDDTDPALTSFDLEADGETTCGGDCDDSSPLFNTSHPEFCDGEDNDCDGVPDNNLVADADGDGFTAEGCGLGGTDCDDGDAHVFPDETYTSGWQRQCKPAVSPGFFGSWSHARLNLPTYFEDPQTLTQYLYFRGHHEQSIAAFGYVSRLPGETDWGDTQGPIFSENPVAGTWDGRRISHPSVAYVPGKVQGYIMAYHAQHDYDISRTVGIATANLPTGQDTDADGVADAPFQRADMAGTAVTSDVIQVSASATAADSERVVNPSLWYDETSQILHMWYTGRYGNPNDFVIVHASCNTQISDCGPAGWVKTDTNSDGDPDIFLEGTSGAWDDLSTQQTFVMEHSDPSGFFGYELEVWYTGGGDAIGYLQGDIADATTWETYAGNPVLVATTAADRFDSAQVAGRGVRYDDTLSRYHMFYESSVTLPTLANGEGDDELWGVGNFSTFASYIGYAFNNAPILTEAFTCTSAAGTVDDNAPDTVSLEVYDGSTLIAGPVFGDATGNTNIAEQTTTFAIPITLAAGAHDITVVASDVGGAQRSVTASLTCP